MRRMTAVGATMLLLLLAAMSGAAANTFTQRLYLRNDGGNSCPGFPYLGLAPGTDEPGCGYQGGLPLGEVYGLTGAASNVRVYDTVGGIAPKILDGSRHVTGNIRVFSWAQSNRVGAGTVRVDVTVAGRLADSSTVSIGEASHTQAVDPTNSAEMDFPFTIAVPDELDGTSLSDISITVDIRGVHVLTGYQRLDGHSWLDVPITHEPEVYVPPATESPTASPAAPPATESPTPSPTPTS